MTLRSALARSCLLLIGLSTGAPAAAQTGNIYPVGKVLVRVDSHWPATTDRGWAPVQIELSNESIDSSDVRLRVGTGWSNDMSNSSQSRTERLEPGETRQVEILVPVDRANGNARYRVHLTSQGEATTVDLGLGAQTVHHLARKICVVSANDLSPAKLNAIRTALPMDDGSTVRGAFKSDTPPIPTRQRWFTGGSDQVAAVFTLPLEDLPRRDQAWSSIDTVVIDATDRLPASANWAPVLAWLRSGGQLVIVGGERARWSTEIDGVERLLAERNRIADRDGIETYRCGFGTLAVVDEPNETTFQFEAQFASMVTPTLERVDEDSGASGFYPSALAAIYGASVDSQPWPIPFPVKQLPLRPVVAFLFLFSILVGPVNVVIARKKKRPGLLFVTVPVLSLAATILILVFGVLRQGFGIKGFAHSVAIVDQVGARATTFERRELFVGRGGESLRPAPGTTALVPDRGEESRDRTISDDGNQLRLGGDFLPVRARTSHLSMRDAPTRVRLDIERGSDGSVTVANGLGVDLRELAVRGPRNELFVLEGRLDAGSSATLKATTSMPSWDGWTTLMEPMFDFAELSDTTYVAIADESPTADDLSLDVRELYGVHVVVGAFDPEEAGWSR